MGRKKKEIKVKEPVRIREKKISGGNISLYLDIYSKGLRKKESLQLYLVPETSSAAKLQNENTRKLAEQIKAQRILDIQKSGLIDWNRVKYGHKTLLGWLLEYSESNPEASDSTRHTRLRVRVRVEEYLKSINKSDIALSDIDKGFCKDFIHFLNTCKFNQGKKTLTQTTCRIFVNTINGALTKAVREGLMDRNPMNLLESKEKPQKNNAEREFLTIDEMKQVMNTDCSYPILKKAFLFCCFTGLRYSDMKGLKWSEIHTAADGKTLYIERKQIKTRHSVTIPLSDEALRWMPKQEEGNDVVFHELDITQTTVSRVLNEWMNDAHIKKHITFHCSRHTAATLLLTLGANLYVVSKLLGHRSIKMTEVYAKIVDKKKIETVNLVNSMFVKP